MANKIEVMYKQELTVKDIKQGDVFRYLNGAKDAVYIKAANNTILHLKNGVVYAPNDYNQNGEIEIINRVVLTRE